MTRRRWAYLVGAAAAVLLLAVGYLVVRGGGGSGPPPSGKGPAGGDRQSGYAPGYGFGSGTPRPSASAGGPSPTPTPGAGWWKPARGATWQWQLTGKLDTSVAVDVYDVDAVNTSAAEVTALHSAGRKTICYVNAGAYEDFRPDKAKYPQALLGKGLDGWPGEKWLDVRRWDLIEPILGARFAMCRDKGFDGVEPDNVDGYSNQSGFPLTAADQLAFNRHLSDLGHRLGLAVGLKNDVEQAAELAPAFDFAVNEECAKYRECDALKVFPAAGKPVFHVEYDLPASQFCPTTKPLGFSSMKKTLNLDAQRTPC